MISTATSAVAWTSVRANFKSEVKRWRQSGVEWDGNVKPKTLVETLDHGNPQFYPELYVAVITLLMYPVSTCTAECIFSSMKPLRSAMIDGTLNSLAILHIYSHKDFDIDDVITEFAGLKGRHLALWL